MPERLKDWQSQLNSVLHKHQKKHEDLYSITISLKVSKWWLCLLFIWFEPVYCKQCILNKIHTESVRHRIFGSSYKEHETLNLIRSPSSCHRGSTCDSEEVELVLKLFHNNSSLLATHLSFRDLWSYIRLYLITTTSL